MPEPRHARLVIRAPADLRALALAVGVVIAFWIHAAAFGRPDAEVYRDIRLPYVAAGLAAMAMANARPLRWMIVAVATAAPTALTGCYFIGARLTDGAALPWVQVRIAATMLAATLIGAVVGRVAGGIRRGL